MIPFYVVLHAMYDTGIHLLCIILGRSTLYFNKIVYKDIFNKKKNIKLNGSFINLYSQVAEK